MIVPIRVQLKGEREPEKHLALVFDDVINAADFIPYRNALTLICKEIVSSAEGNFCDEVFWLLQMAEFISSSLDDELEKRHKSLSAYQRGIAEANDRIFQEVLSNLNENNNEQQ